MKKVDDVRRTYTMIKCKKQGTKSPCDNTMITSLALANMPEDVPALGGIKTMQVTGTRQRA